MSKGTFQLISESYRNGAKGLFRYCQTIPFLLKPFFYCYALVVSIVLHLCSSVFYVLIIFDYLASFINSIRSALFNTIQKKSRKILNSTIAFLFNPLLIALLTPIFILSAILPKISSELEIDDFTGDIIDNSDITGSGTFKKIITFSIETVHNSFIFFREKSIFLWGLLIIPCITNSILMFILILISIPLMLLDLLSYIIDSIRKVCVKISQGLGQSTIRFSGYLFSPFIMVLLVPVFLAILIVPKFSTGIDMME